VKVIPTNLSEDWQALDGQETQEGLITIRGFDPDGINSDESGSSVDVLLYSSE